MDIVDNPRDFYTYFRNTYIGLDDGNKIIPCLVDRVEEGDRGWQCHIRPQNSQGRIADGAYEPFEQVVDRYILVPPEVGAVSTEHNLIYVSFRPLRQFRKGMEDRRLIFHSFTDMVFPPITLKKVIWDIFNPVKFELKELYDMLMQGKRLGGALDNRFGLVLKPTIKYPLLTYKNSTIGVCTPHLNVFLLPGFTKYKEHIERDICPTTQKWD